MGFLLGAAAGAASGLLGAVSGNSQLKKQLNFQREENEKNRQYNRELAEQQNKWNIEQWQRENAYNNPAEMRKRLEAALVPRFGLSASSIFLRKIQDSNFVLRPKSESEVYISLARDGMDRPEAGTANEQHVRSILIS